MQGATRVTDACMHPFNQSVHPSMSMHEDLIQNTELDARVPCDRHIHIITRRLCPTQACMQACKHKFMVYTDGHSDTQVHDGQRWVRTKEFSEPCGVGQLVGKILDKVRCNTCVHIPTLRPWTGPFVDLFIFRRTRHLRCSDDLPVSRTAAASDESTAKACTETASTALAARIQ